MTANPTDIVHLTASGVSVAIDLSGPGLPVILHWGAPLGEATGTELSTMSAVLGAPGAPSSVDTAVRTELVPQASSGHSGRPGVRGNRDGRQWSPAFGLTGTSAGASGEPGPGSVTYAATCRRTQLELTGTLELTAQGLLRLRHTLRNQGDSPYTLDGLEVALPVPAQAGELLDLTGRWGRERHPQRHPLHQGAWVRENRRGRTGHDATIGLLAGTPGFGFRHGEVWGLHVAWSGNHVTYAEQQHAGTARLGGGELLLSGEIILQPGEEYMSPWVYAGYSPAGIDGLSAAFHGWLRSRPSHPSSPRPVVFNTWEAVYFDHDLGRLRELADAAARVGAERFVLDDGWFRGRRDDSAGLGDWYVDADVWPDGLTPLIEHVRGLGMEFGLWVEPEMVNPDSDLYRAHPDWVLRPNPETLPPPARNQQVLDVANPATYSYLLERLDELLTGNDIAYLKWDHNRDLVDAGHAGRAGVHEQTQAVYRLLAELRERHPGVEIESCSSGGGRVDLGILQHTDRVWASDCNDALERQSIQRWTGVFLPPELIGAHVGATQDHSTGRTNALGLRLATALSGHFGVEWDITSATDAERAGLTEAIAFYKEVRDLLHHGEVVRADHPDPAAWVYGVVAPDRSRALFWYVQLTSSAHSLPVPARFPGLDPDRRYRVGVVEPGGSPRLPRHSAPGWTEAADVVLSGRMLSEVGLQPPIIAPAQAVLVRLDASK